MVTCNVLGAPGGPCLQLPALPVDLPQVASDLPEVQAGALNVARQPVAYPPGSPRAGGRDKFDAAVRAVVGGAEVVLADGCYFGFHFWCSYLLNTTHYTGMCRFVNTIMDLWHAEVDPFSACQPAHLLRSFPLLPPSAVKCLSPSSLWSPEMLLR